MSGEVLALVSALLWSVASVLMALGSHRLHVLPLNLIRCVVSSVFFWALLPFYGGLEAFRTVPSSAWLWLVVSVLILLVVGDTLYFRSLNLAGVSWAMPVAGINPLWAILLAALFVDEPLTWSLLLGALLVVAGVTLLSRPEMHSSNGQDIEPAARRKGLLIALLVSLLWGAGQVTLKPATAGMHSVVANSIRQPLAMFILLAINLRTGLWKELRRLDPDDLGDHLDRLYRAAWALCGDRHDAEDLVQETYAGVLARPRWLRGEDDLGYLLRALRNTHAGRLRTASRRPRTGARHPCPACRISCATIRSWTSTGAMAHRCRNSR